MRSWMLALALAGVAGVAIAQVDTQVDDEGHGGGDEVRSKIDTPWAPSGAPRQAEQALSQALGAPNGLRFQSVRAIEVAEVKHSAFESPIQGPVTFVCGEYGLLRQAGDYSPYSWFSVAIKRGKVLWTTPDAATGELGTAYYSCKGAGLAK